MAKAALAFCLGLAVWIGVVATGCSEGSTGFTAVDASMLIDSASSCAAPRTACSGACVDTSSDPGNCGGCNKACGGGEVCSKGACSLTCASGLALCAASDAGAAYCADTTSDQANCGSCGHACPAGTACSGGMCGTTCGGGQTLCTPDAGAAFCANLVNDPNNCGVCGMTCPSGQVCAGSMCSLSCQRGLIDCGGTCIDPNLSNSNCGATPGCGVGDAGIAGTACGPGQVCNMGTCAFSCPAGEVECGGQCVDPATDNQYCGATAGCGAGDAGTAGQACTNGQLCGMGVCSVSCPANQINCGGTCVDPQTSNQNCGATAGCGADAGSGGTTCTNGQVCNLGVCGVSCPGTEVDCGGECTDPGTSNQHCGATPGCGAGAGTPGMSCTPGEICTGGICTISCPGSEVACNGECVDPGTSNQYCGATAGCGVSGNGSVGMQCTNGQVCNGGTCSVSCPGTEVNCAGTCVNPATDPNHCGATVGCGAGSGSGGTACGAGLMCSGGGCVPSCQSPLIACNGACVDPRNDPTHCGGCSPCGPVANAANPVCRNSACVVGTCATGYQDCDGTYSDGCEVYTQGDRENCGFCTNACMASDSACNNGICSSCVVVNGIRWCYDPNNCGQACSTVCSKLGLPFTISPAAWFAAQDSAPECQAISDAFGMTGPIQLAGWAYACNEDSGGTEAAPGGLLGSLFCSTYSGCPAAHEATMDQNGVACGAGARRSVCPCQ